MAALILLDVVASLNSTYVNETLLNDSLCGFDKHTQIVAPELAALLP